MGASFVSFPFHKCYFPVICLPLNLLIMFRFKNTTTCDVKANYCVCVCVGVFVSNSDVYFPFLGVIKCKSDSGRGEIEFNYRNACKSFVVLLLHSA